MRRSESLDVSTIMSMQPGYPHLFSQTLPTIPGLIAAQIDNDSHTPIFDTTIEEFDKVMNINARGVLTCTRAVSKAMLAQDSRHTTTRSGTRDLGRGSIVNLGSANSYAAIPGKVAYVASKHAVMGITKASGELPQNRVCWSNLSTNPISAGLRNTGRPSQCSVPDLGPDSDV